MILIYGHYPFPELLRSGWMRRVAVVDRIFGDRPRTYVWPLATRWMYDRQDYRLRSEDVGPSARSVRLDLRFSNHQRHLAELVDEAEMVYAHTSHSAQHLLPFYGSRKIVTDLHGLAPEEEAMQGRPGRAALFEGFEETMVRDSRRLVAVTEAMADHFRSKYPGLDTPFTILPIVDEMDAERVNKGQSDRRTVIYSGGAQTWQNVDRMLEAVKVTRERYQFEFYSADLDAIGEATKRHGVDSLVKVESADPSELSSRYAKADFGFVLRNDSPVNRASCPTKLSEYLATGVIPIVDLVEIGDFARLDYRYVSIEDFIADRVPNAGEMADMRRANRGVFDRLRERYESGAIELRSLRIDSSDTQSISMTALPSVLRDIVLPLAGIQFVVVRESGTHELVLDDLASPRVRVDLELPGDGELRELYLCSGDTPLVTTPITLALVDASGAAHGAELGTARTDRFGNLLLDRFDEQLPISFGSVTAPTRIQCNFDVVLAGPEVHAVAEAVAPPQVVNSWRRRVSAAIRRLRGA